MFRKLSGLAVILAAVVVSGCSSVTPGPGEEVVIVRYPTVFKLFTNGGVDPNPVRSGRQFIALTTSGYTVDVKPIRFTMFLDDLFSRDNVPLDFNATLRLQVTDSVMIVDKFGVQPTDIGNGVIVPSWYVNNVADPWFRFTRQSVRDYGMNELVADSTAEGAEMSAIERIDQVVSEQMEKYFTSIGLPVKLVELTIGRAAPPEEIKAQRIATSREEQRQRTEFQRDLAEQQRKAAEASRAAADNAYRNGLNLSAEQFIRLEALRVRRDDIEMQREVCVSGKCTFVVNGGGAVPTIDINRQ